MAYASHMHSRHVRYMHGLAHATVAICIANHRLLQ
jgi:hypothetical protein